jgi:C-terminal processing protease CtpA/Prc
MKRSGMLQVGDQILYVNNASLKNRPLAEVNQLLRANEEVVKLKLKKDELYAGFYFFKYFIKI